MNLSDNIHIEYLKQWVIKELLEAGIVEKSTNKWASPIVVIKKTEANKYAWTIGH